MLGSADEKHPYLVLTIEKLGVSIIVLIDGKGYKEQAFDWLKSQVTRESSLIDVCTMRDFQKLVNQGFLE